MHSALDEHSENRAVRIQSRLALRLQQTSKLTPNLAEQAYSRLKLDLFNLALLPGQVFSEHEIVGALCMSRTPVRQALQRLAREGYVQVSQRKGWQVRPFDWVRFEQLYDLRVVLELAALERLCRFDVHQRQTKLAQLLAIWDVPKAQRLPMSREVARLDEDFHCQLLTAAGNAEMAQVHREVTEKISFIRRLDFTQTQRVDATYDEHAEILHALQQGHLDAAKKYLKTHIESSKAVVCQITQYHLEAARELLRGWY